MSAKGEQMIENGTRRSKWQQRRLMPPTSERTRKRPNRKYAGRLATVCGPVRQGIELTDKAAVSSSADEICVPHNDWKY